MLLSLAFLIMSLSQNAYSIEPDKLHVPSPDWQDQIIYFLVTDRFSDGDSSNNDQGAGEFDQQKNEKYSGGDIQGVIDKIPYIKELGATAVWITPVLANQWWDPWNSHSGYHGYWTENFKAVDKHMGDLNTYKKLSSELHKNDMYLIQDIVCNHVGDFFRYNGPFDPKDPTKNFELNMDSKPSYRPSQYPFDHNDVRNPKDRAMHVYHWTPDITNFNDPKQKYRYQMSTLDDLNTSNKLVRDALKDSYSYWIKEVGVDAFRVDTATYVEQSFWNDFNPWMENFAKKLGKKDFLIFAETWLNADPFRPEGDKEAAAYISYGKFSSIINFSMQMDIERVIGRGSPTAFLSYRVKNLYKYYKNPHQLVNFIDNHDMSRFLSNYGKDNFIQAMAFILTIPGIPSIYYGAEQGFKATRSSMFKAGVGSEGTDHFKTNSEYFKLVKDLIKIRKDNAVFRRGEIAILKDSKSEPGVFAYEMKYKKDHAIVMLNTSSDPVIMDNLQTDLKSGTVLTSVFSNNTDGKPIIIGEKGGVSKVLDPKALSIYIVAGNDSARAVQNKITEISVLNFTANKIMSGNFDLEGKADDSLKDRDILLVIDNNLKDAVPVVSIGNSWSVAVPVDNLSNGAHELVLVAIDGKNNIDAISKSYDFSVNIPFKKVLEFNDKAGDDKGPTATYSYPSDATFKGQMDIEKVTIYKAGNNLKLSIKMVNPISQAWNPKNGFDHVVFSVYIGLPTQNGATQMPFQHSEIKNGMKWDYLIFLAGWNNAAYSSINSSKDNFGTPVGPAPKIEVDLKQGTLNFTISAKTLGRPQTLSGSKMYITTWDYDGMESKYRQLAPNAMPFTFGGAASDSPYIMDDTDVLLIP
ncbi:MAG: alpha-amylase family glycosyl hydrolase [bacterium]